MFKTFPELLLILCLAQVLDRTKDLKLVPREPLALEKVISLGKSLTDNAIQQYTQVGWPVLKHIVVLMWMLEWSKWCGQSFVKLKMPKRCKVEFKKCQRRCVLLN